MSSTIRSRVLDIMLEELRKIPGINLVSKDLRPWASMTGRYPCLFVVAASGGSAESQRSGHERDQLAIHVWGYVRSDTEQPDGISDKREEFYGQVLDILLGETLQTAFKADVLKHNGSGPLGFYKEGAPDVDEGVIPPYGVFRQRGYVILHYQRGQMTSSS